MGGLENGKFSLLYVVKTSLRRWLVQKSLKTPLRNIKMAPYINYKMHFWPITEFVTLIFKVHFLAAPTTRNDELGSLESSDCFFPPKKLSNSVCVIFSRKISLVCIQYKSLLTLPLQSPGPSGLGRGGGLRGRGANTTPFQVFVEKETIQSPSECLGLLRAF